MSNAPSFLQPLGDTDMRNSTSVEQFLNSLEKGHNANGENANSELLDPRGSPVIPRMSRAWPDSRGYCSLFPLLSFMKSNSNHPGLSQGCVREKHII